MPDTGASTLVVLLAGIDRVEEQKVRERTEDYVRWEKRYRGLCRNEYYVGTPATRTVSEVYNETTFRLEPAKIKVRAGLPCSWHVNALYRVVLQAFRA